MRFGVNTLIWSAAFDSSIPLEEIRKAGIDGIEVPVFVPEDLDVAALRKALAEYGLGCTFCSVNPAGCNPISDDPAVRAKSVEHWKRVIATAAEVGAELIAGPTYSPVGHLPGRRRTADEWKWAVEFHQAIAPALDQHNVGMAVEPLNRFETYFLNTAADAVKLVEQIGSPRIGILCDTFHSNIEEKSVPEAYRTCGRHLKHVHTCENDRGVPGTGHVDWHGVLSTLKAIGYDGWLTIESFNSAMKELAAATAIWRDLAPKTDDIAIQGTAFLKKSWAALNERSQSK